MPVNARLLWWPPVVRGAIAILFGVLAVVWPALFWPQITAIALAWLIAFWALFTGILEVSASFRLREVIGSFPWLMFGSGLLSIVLGVVIAFMPGRGAVGLVWAIGVLSLVCGVTLIALGLYVRAAGRTDTTVGDQAPHPPAAPA